MFDNIIGNDKIKHELINKIQTKQYLSSIIFLGKSGIGKKMIAREFSKMLLCTSNEQKYCGKCKSCLEFDSNNNPDFFEITPDGNSIKINQIREFQEKAYEMPIISERKVYIIDNADTATVEAQNALLKVLEEPPKFLNIILIGSIEHNFLNTIKSRCIIFKFEEISDDEIKKYLFQNFKVQDLPNDLIKAASGSIGKAIFLKDKKETYEQVAKFINELETSNIIKAFKNANILYKLQDEKYEVLDYMNVVFFEKAKQNNRYLNCINCIEQTKKRLLANSNYNMSIDNMIMTIWEEIH